MFVHGNLTTREGSVVVGLLIITSSILDAFNIENIFSLLNKTSYHYEEVNRSESSLSVRSPWFVFGKKQKKHISLNCVHKNQACSGVLFITLHFLRKLQMAPIN
jgi:hypothetical protein